MLRVCATWDLNSGRHSFSGDIDAMDLWPLGLLEEKIPGGLVGPTLSCLLADQFQRTKAGDRFFYTHKVGGHCLIMMLRHLQSPKELA